MKHFLLYSLLLFSSLYAKELSLDPYISDLKQKEFSYDYEKSLLEKKKLRDSWVQPLQLQYSLSRRNPYNEQGASVQQSQSAAIVFDQPIFRSGGIYYGIKFAQASYQYNKYSIDVAKRMMIKDAVSLLMQIRQSDLAIERQELQIDNSRINLEQKKEQYLNGQLDSGFLNNAIIEKNRVTQALYDLQTNKERLISKFEAISDLDYKDAKIPALFLIDKESFLEYNIEIKQAQSEGAKNKYNKNVISAQYLPSISLTAGYNWDKNENLSFAGSGSITNETKYYNYGLKASMPLDFNTFRDIESSQVDYLKSLARIADKKRELISLYEQVTQNLKNFDNKIGLSIENKELYSKLLDDTKQLYKAGYKTQYDVQNLSNSVEIEKVDQKIFELDKQLELLDLYEKLISDAPLEKSFSELDNSSNLYEPETEKEPLLVNDEAAVESMELTLLQEDENAFMKEIESVVEQDLEGTIDAGYYIQVSSFLNFKPNKVFFQKIMDNNYEYKLHKVFINEQSFTKVLIGPFEHISQADEAMKVIHAKIEPDAFLVRN